MKTISTYHGNGKYWGKKSFFMNVIFYVFYATSPGYELYIWIKNVTLILESILLDFEIICTNIL